MITEGLKTSRMQNAEPEKPSIDSVMASAPVQQSAPAAAPQAPPPPQGMPPGAPPPPGGMPPEEDVPPSPDGINHFASNGLMLLHDKSTAPEYEKMIATGIEGAATAAVTIGEIVMGEFEKRGEKVSSEEKTMALEEIIGDIAEIGMSVNPQAFPSEPKVKGEPIALHATLLKSLDMWAQRRPEDGQKMAADMQALAGGSTPEDDAAAQQVAEFMKTIGPGGSTIAPQGGPPAGPQQAPPQALI